MTSIDTLTSILSMFEDTSSTGRGLTDELGEQIFMLVGCVSVFSQKLLANCIIRELRIIKGHFNTLKKRSRLRRMVETPRDAQNIARCFRRLQGFINEIVVCCRFDVQVPTILQCFIQVGSALKAEVRLAVGLHVHCAFRILKLYAL